MWAGPEASGIDFVRLQADLEAGAETRMDRIVTAEDRDAAESGHRDPHRGSPAIRNRRLCQGRGDRHHRDGNPWAGVMGHLLMGNVAEKLVRIAPCPVLTVHHPEHEFIQL